MVSRGVAERDRTLAALTLRRAIDGKTDTFLRNAHGATCLFPTKHTGREQDKEEGVE